jgi:trehalose 6-phosphate phosphatase
LADRSPGTATDRELPPALTLDHALFLDLDGTLAPIAPRPNMARVPRATIEVLGAASAALGGAVAIISGRTMADLDALLAPLKLPAAGCHGAEWRGANGMRHGPDAAHQTQTARIANVVRAGAGDLLVEEKVGAVALHFRTDPSRQAECVALMHDIAGAVAGWQVIEGKMVVEARLEEATKAHAVARLMAEKPFAARVPVFVGDDVTDEDGFAAVAALGGFGIKVGAGQSVARFRLADPANVMAWLSSPAAGT